MPLAPIKYSLIVLFALASIVHAVESGDTLSASDEQISSVLRDTAMPELEGGRLGKILTRYYQKGLGGPETWDDISSLKVTGALKLKNGDFVLNAFQKKPNMIKLTITGNQRDLVLAYDGETAWHQLPEPEASPELMTPDEARRFIHSSHFGNYLLYPYAEGKKIEYIDTVPVEGTICHQVRVTLDTDYQVDYFIDIRAYIEIKVVNTDLRSGFSNSILYKDYFREQGMPIAKHVENYENGEWVSSLTVEEVKVNSGVIPWMFKMR